MALPGLGHAIGELAEIQSIEEFFGNFVLANLSFHQVNRRFYIHGPTEEGIDDSPCTLFSEKHFMAQWHARLGKLRNLLHQIFVPHIL